MRLHVIAQNMLDQVDRGVTDRAAVRLQHGLALTLRFNEGVYTLSCGRKNSTPSQTELEVVANAFKLLAPVWRRADVEEWTVWSYSWRFVFVE